MIIKRQSTRDVREYLQIVLNRFPDNCEIYDKITKLLKDLRLARVRSTYNDVISKVSQLFKEHKVLLLGFNKFLPPGYKITLPKDQTQRRKPEFRDAAEFINKVKERLQDEHAYKVLLRSIMRCCMSSETTRICVWILQLFSLLAIDDNTIEKIEIANSNWII
ncbi:BnaC02g19570D [Brassica napus]|uniref:BnaC02g19570D protein n=1 Tax=Brassica napus TaxID=3708 RepID=A0A078I1M8_BRANA|nr:BnaC02g19570D [Brassica napus]